MPLDDRRFRCLRRHRPRRWPRACTAEHHRKLVARSINEIVGDGGSRVTLDEYRGYRDKGLIRGDWCDYRARVSRQSIARGYVVDRMEKFFQRGLGCTTLSPLLFEQREGERKHREIRTMPWSLVIPLFGWRATFSRSIVDDRSTSRLAARFLPPQPSLRRVPIRFHVSLRLFRYRMPPPPAVFLILHLPLLLLHHQPPPPPSSSISSSSSSSSTSRFLHPSPPAPTRATFYAFAYFSPFLPRLPLFLLLLASFDVHRSPPINLPTQPPVELSTTASAFPPRKTVHLSHSSASSLFLFSLSLSLFLPTVPQDHRTPKRGTIACSAPTNFRDELSGSVSCIGLCRSGTFQFLNLHLVR